MSLSPQRREEVIDALRRGTVPRSSLDAFAVGLERFEGAIDEDLRKVGAGGSVFKAVRGEYGCGKTFFARWLADRARKLGFASSEVQVSETETPLHRLETVYRRLMERLSTADTPQGALRNVVDGWFYALEEDVLAEGTVGPDNQQALVKRTGELLEQRLAKVTATAPTFSAALRGYREAQAKVDKPTAEGILAWLAGQPNVAAGAKRAAGVKGDIDHFGALSFLQGVLIVMRDSGHPGLLLILDEVETIQRVRGDVRDKSPQCPAAAYRRGGCRPFSRPVPARHGHAVVLRRPPGCPAAGTPGPAAARRFPDRRPLRQPPGRADPAAGLQPRSALPGRLQGPRHLPAACQGPGADRRVLR